MLEQRNKHVGLWPQVAIVPSAMEGQLWEEPQLTNDGRPDNLC